jgi:glycosyltransferase involved in cell wall biosynthesis
VRPPTITVFVPTYNRAHLLGRVFESLNAQTFKDFEWVIVDNASSDNTEELVHSWQQDAAYEIRYRRKTFGGKHTSINVGVEMAQSEFFVMLDSDDWLVPTALERMLELWQAIPDQDRFSAVVGLCARPDGSIVGDRFPSDPLDSNAVELNHGLKIRGDKMSLGRTAVMREFPFPFQESPGFVTESLVWNRMAQRYQERYVNEVFAIKDYQPDGLSDRALEMQIRMPLAARLYYLELSQVQQRIDLKERLKALVNYMKYSMHAGITMAATLREARTVLAIALLPVAMLLFFRDRRRFGRIAMLTQLGLWFGLGSGWPEKLHLEKLHLENPQLETLAWSAASLALEINVASMPL